jgi:hypothetical protein
MSTNDREGIPFAESESPIIQWGITPTDSIFEDYVDENRQTNSANLNAICALARLHQHNDGILQRRRPRDSLLAERNKLLDLANSTRLLTGGLENKGTSLQEDNLSNPMPDNNNNDSFEESEIQNPSQTSQLDEPESQIFHITDSAGIGSDKFNEESETQIPAQFFRAVPQVDSVSQAVDALPPNTSQTASGGKKPRGRPRLVGDVPSVTPGARLPDMWCECVDIYPDADEIATALQDAGKRHSKVVNGSRQQVSTFPLIQKVCTKIYQRIQSIYKPEGLTKNISRGRESLTSLVLLSRKLTDAMYLDTFFHRYAKNGQVYTITNNATHCGLDIPVKEFQATIMDQIKKAKSTRTCNDGLRLALTLLDPKYREAASIVMSHKKDRVHSDINGDHVLHLFEHILGESFKDINYKPPMPDSTSFGELEEDELCQWDPNDPKIFEVERDASWLLDTWRVYIKRKYKVALDRWNKETRGGNGQPWSFVNYCDRDARWLVIVFLQDIGANYLLASNAGGRMPLHLQMECRVESPAELSSLESTASNQQQPRTTSSIHKRSIVDAARETKKLKSDISDVVIMISSMYKDRENSKRVSQTQPPQHEFTNSNEVLAQIQMLNNALNDHVTIESMPSTTRSEYVQALNEKRNRLTTKMLELVRAEATAN